MEIKYRPIYSRQVPHPKIAGRFKTFDASRLYTEEDMDIPDLFLPEEVPEETDGEQAPEAPAPAKKKGKKKTEEVEADGD